MLQPPMSSSASPIAGLNHATTPGGHSVSVVGLSLPKGSGTLRGMSASPGAIGPDGAATLSLPLPISAGRGFAPALTLNYHSGGGNGAFGLGWALPVPTVRRRTDRGVPRYSLDDTFVGPGGEVLVPERDEKGQVVSREVGEWLGSPLPQTYTVTRYFPCVEATFNRLEHYTGANGVDLWVMQASDGQIHRFGLTTDARLADPADPKRIAEWRIEDSLSPLGERILYRYAAENGAGATAIDRDMRAARYLVAVHYGNIVPLERAALWQESEPDDSNWLFSVVFDYGERGLDAAIPPPYVPARPWDVRQDSFSRYDYGFEHRLWRLCRQVLMYHRFPEELHEPITLVGRLLLEYEESPVVSYLAALHHMAYEAGDPARIVAMPPLELEYSAFALDSPRWQRLETLSHLTDMGRCQWIDLYGEGIPGLLYRTAPEWRYRPPVRDTEGADPDAVTYGPWQILPQVPASQDGPVRLMDIDGDSRLDWVVTQPGLAGYFTLNVDRQWSAFIPMAALPTEFFEAQAQLADLCGGGQPDLVLIGPRSVRLYANQGQGYAGGVVVAQDDGIALPVAGRDATELVAFSDVLGSGHAHLVRVRHDAVTCWPSLGHGSFGAPLVLGGLALDPTSFNPAQVLLADIDGTGAADVIYWQHDRLVIHRNQSGNGFAAAVTVLYPDGLTLSHLTDIQAADIEGKGITTLIINSGGAEPQHWRLSFTAGRPHLLVQTNNNMGAAGTLAYRSSAQYWLDEKLANPRAVCHLPFPIQIVALTVQADELTGNVLTQSYHYARGRYDPREREFRGFGYLEARDTSSQSQRTAMDSASIPLLSRCWYHTGDAVDETGLAGCWNDDDAIILKPTRLAEGMKDADADALWWGYRALKGRPLRQETFSLNNPAAPYHVTLWRYQIDRLQRGYDEAPPVILPLLLEQADSRYEQVIGDPSVSQHVTLAWDRYGTPTRAVTVTYPRRPKPASSLYPPTLPASAWDASYDPQQQRLLLSETRQSTIHLDNDQEWRLGLADQQRHDVLVYDGYVRDEGWLSAESLADAAGLLAPAAPRRLAGQSQVKYEANPPTLQALVSHNVIAVLDENGLGAYEGVPFCGELTDLLTQAGYILQPALLPVEDAVTKAPVWCVEQGFKTYGDAAAFYRPLTHRTTKLTAPVAMGYDTYGCGPITETDSLGQVTHAVLDYRHLSPFRVLDINGNTQEIRLDALGRVVCASHYGTEGGQEVGFAALAAVPPEGLPQTTEAALGWHEPLRVAQVIVSDLFSWMGCLTEDEANELQIGEGAEAQAGPGWDVLLAKRAITPTGHIRCRRTATPLGKALQSRRAGQSRLPPHIASLTADSYPNAGKQQVRMAVSYSDGFGRALQQVSLVAPGPAWRRTENGSLETDADGTPILSASNPRWAVTGRVEYDAKGQATRAYRPYFVNDWRYVRDDAARTDAYADTHTFDALGRECRVVTAAGALRRIGYFPWFTVHEDENDTWWETGAVVQELSHDRATAPADGTTTVTLTAMVLDEHQQPMTGLGVDWSVQGDGRLTAPVTLTDAEGKAQVGLNSRRAGLVTVAARVGIQAETTVVITFSSEPELA
ncbi:Insecticidal toxin complex protein TcaC [Granulibacter bethesdensis]|uniref:Insecticidal toxin complex protein TcaC n=1 Tax=Granulibacter bethesdensis TaxID=364410 RepID=A0AAN0VFI1_9PROT|nr:SpvB/TcaC N-terminal domain-containing protein [Granulibacter bethesdensis]AHJ62551.1 Insecticidal toxin complex protein TcaC [Granulibacter bethesdensis]